jgi:hypothetical protein
MAKNKKKGVLKVIPSQPISNDTNIDETNKISKQVIVSEQLENPESAKHTEPVEHAKQHFDNKPNNIIDSVEIHIEKNELSILTTKIHDEVIISQPINNLDCDSLSIEYNVISSDEQNLEIIQILNMKNNTNCDIELTEIKIEKNETREQVSPQTKQTNCSRVWCSIL